MRKSTVYIPGVWDIFHIGHLSYLKKARKLGKKLIVGVQSDEFVYRQKGEYPIIKEEDRVKFLKELGFIDDCFIYDNDQYRAHLKIVNANILVLSERYKSEQRFFEAVDYLKCTEGKVVYFPYDDSISSTKIKTNIRNEWGNIWKRVALENKDDFSIVGRPNPEDSKELADYINNKLHINPTDITLDFGCGTGVITEYITSKVIGIDISNVMVQRAFKNSNRDLFLVSDTIPFIGKIDNIYSYGVLHYLPDLSKALDIVDKMISLSSNILLMELPDITKREQRLEYRKKIGKILLPEPLYFNKEDFIKRGFDVFDTEIKKSDNSDFSFSAFYEKV